MAMYTKECQLVSIGPAMVDIALDIVSEDAYYKILEILHTEPGGWVPIEEKAQLEQVLGVVLHVTGFRLDRDFELLQQDPQVEIVSGSTGLGLLSAFPKRQRQTTSLLTVVGSTDGVNPDTQSQFFLDDLKKLDIRAITVPVSGSTPHGLIVATRHVQEKVLGMFPGVARELTKIPIELDASTVVHLDAYELRTGKMSETLDRLIESKQCRIALGLGNSTILHGELKEKILHYINNGYIDFIMGNSAEICALYDLETLHPHESSLNKLGIHHHVRHALITFAEKGMCLYSNSEFFFIKAVNTQNIVNTSGAGDTAAGVFLSGLLANERPQNILHNAARYASKVLQIKGSKLPNGRER